MGQEKKEQRGQVIMISKRNIKLSSRIIPKQQLTTIHSEFSLKVNKSVQSL